MHLLFGTWFGWWFIAFVLYSVPVIIYGARAQASILIYIQRKYVGA